MMANSQRFDVTSQLPALRRYGQVLTRDPAEAEELVQETLLKAYERRSTFRPGEPLGPWLLSILHNCFVDGFRKKRSEQKMLVVASRFSDAHQAPPQEHQVRLTQLRRSFMALPDDQRTALHLVAIEGLSYQDAATALGVPVGTLMSRLGRARAALRSIEETTVRLPSPPAEKRMPQLRIVGGQDDGSD